MLRKWIASDLAFHRRSITVLSAHTLFTLCQGKSINSSRSVLQFLVKVWLSVLLSGGSCSTKERKRKLPKIYISHYWNNNLYVCVKQQTMIELKAQNEVRANNNAPQRHINGTNLSLFSLMKREWKWKRFAIIKLKIFLFFYFFLAELYREW